MSISDTVIKMASTVADKAVEAGNAVVDAAQTAASSAVNVVEKVTGMDLNGDGSIGEKAAEVAAAEVEVSKDAKTD
jgi:hypothetical protein